MSDSRSASPSPGGEGLSSSAHEAVCRHSGALAHGDAALHDCRVSGVHTFGVFTAVTVVAPRLAATVEPGQFVMVQVPGGRFLLRRPLSVFAALGDTVSLLVEARGAGSAALAGAHVGDTLSIQGPIGNGFPLEGVGSAILVGGGIGTAPLQLLADRLSHLGARVAAVFGFRDARMARVAGAFHIEDLWVASEDGSIGLKGNVIDLLTTLTRPPATAALPGSQESDAAESMETIDLSARPTIFACGPDGMVAAVQRWATDHDLSGWASLEAHMACGTGSCHGCVVPTTSGYQRVCADGPVFPLAEITHG